MMAEEEQLLKYFLCSWVRGWNYLITTWHASVVRWTGLPETSEESSRSIWPQSSCHKACGESNWGGDGCLRPTGKSEGRNKDTAPMRMGSQRWAFHTNKRINELTILPLQIVGRPQCREQSGWHSCQTDLEAIAAAICHPTPPWWWRCARRAQRLAGTVGKKKSEMRGKSNVTGDCDLGDA